MDEENTKKGSFPGESIGMIKVKQRCESCDKHILKTAKSVNGVKMANWSIDSSVLIVEFDERKTSLNIIEWEIAEAGHDTPRHKGNIKYYSLIPKCCQYHEELNREI